MDKKFRSEVKLSVRVVGKPGLPGDDITLYNIKIGSSLKADGPLRGLNFDEEAKYLPQIISVSPKDVNWRSATNAYWNNISVAVPADGSTTDELQGKPLSFVVEFNTKDQKDLFDNIFDFKRKAEFIEQLEADSKVPLVISGIASYILFRYALVYGRVANKIEDIRKSPKIDFYLYSKQFEVKSAYSLLKERSKAMELFVSILSPDKEKVVDALLLMFGEDLTSFKDLESKHLVLESKTSTKPKEFIKYANDTNLPLKGLIYKAVNMQIIHRPSNTDSYYYGDNNEQLLGNTLTDAVLFLKSENEKNKQILAIIKAKVKNKV